MEDEDEEFEEELDEFEESEELEDPNISQNQSGKSTAPCVRDVAARFDHVMREATKRLTTAVMPVELRSHARNFPCGRAMSPMVGAKRCTTKLEQRKEIAEKQKEEPLINTHLFDF